MFRGFEPSSSFLFFFFFLQSNQVKMRVVKMKKNINKHGEGITLIINKQKIIFYKSPDYSVGIVSHYWQGIQKGKENHNYETIRS